MDQLTDDAKKLIEEQCETVLQRYTAAIKEVEIYKWAARVFFTVVLGGSVIGFFQLQDYLDDRITKGTMSLDGLFLAKSLADGGQTDDALPELLEFARSMSSTPIPQGVSYRTDKNLFGDLGKAGPNLRAYFFLSVLDVISSIPSLDDQGVSFGRVEWLQLQNNARFRTDILLNPRWANEPRVLNRIGLARAKFANGRPEMLSIKDYFERQFRNAKRNDDKAASSFALAVYSLSDDEIPEAESLFYRAAHYVPGWVKKPDELFSTTAEPYYWAKLFSSRDEFRERYTAATKNLLAPPLSESIVEPREPAKPPPQ